MRYRPPLSFRAVNRRGRPGHDPALQRHHLLPRQVLNRSCFSVMFESLGRERLGFEDFRENGLLLPAREAAVVRLGLPLHRGPHRAYNALVMERVGQVESHWASRRGAYPDAAAVEAVQRLGLLQKALRRRLLTRRRSTVLCRFDPVAVPYDFTELDSLADALWPATQVGASLAES